MARPVAEVKVHRRIGGHEHPAHDVGADRLGRLVEGDRVALALVHILTVLVAHRGIPEQGAGHRLVGHHRRHREQGVEPVAELAGERLGYEVRREPVAPVGAIRVPAQRRKANDSPVEPRIPDVGDPSRAATARGAGDLDRVHPGPVRGVPLEGLPAGDRAIAQLVTTADHLPRLAVLADPDGQREAVVALLADHPVAHISQPVQLALLEADALRKPADLTRDLRDRLPQRVHPDEPLVDQPEDELRAASPADRVAVQVTLSRHEQALALQVGSDVERHVLRRVGCGTGEAPGLPAVAVLEDPELIDRIQNGQPVLLAEREVLLATAGGDVHDPGPLLVGDLVPCDDGVLHALLNRQLVERALVGQTHELASRRGSDDRRVSGHSTLRAV